MSDAITRKVSNGAINIYGEKFKNEELKEYNGCAVVLVPAVNDCGYDIYFKTKFICYIQTIDPSLKGIRICKVCGCTDDNCSKCIERTGKSCYWINESICSACLDKYLFLADFLSKQIVWSKKTFGSSKRTLGIIKHIRKELIEIKKKPEDLSEWIDVIILALDGYWRHGGKPEEIMLHLYEKQKTNFNRVYPYPTSENEPSEHIRSSNDTTSN